MRRPDIAAAIADRIVRENGSVFVSGNAKKMPQDVKAAVVCVLLSYGGDGFATEADALKYVNVMVKSGRFVVDAW